MANSRRKRLEREIDRDARVTTSGFVHEVVAATLGQLQRLSLASGCPDPVVMFDEVDAITRKFRSFHRRLNDARINRRGDRDRDAAPPAQLPPALRPFAYHGRYLGAFPNVEAFAHACIDPGRPELWASHVDLTQVGIDLHLSGRFWTVDDDGVTHAFALADPGTRDRAEHGAPGPAARVLHASRRVYWLRRRDGTSRCEAWRHQPGDAPLRGMLTRSDRDVRGRRKVVYSYAVGGETLTLLGPNEFRALRGKAGPVELARARGCLLTRPLALAADALQVGDERWYLRRGACERARAAGVVAQPDPDCGR